MKGYKERWYNKKKVKAVTYTNVTKMLTFVF